MSGIVLEASQRRVLRRAVRTECQAVTELDFGLLGTSAIDLSTEGMLVETEREPAIGEEVIVSFRAPGTRLWLDAEAHVARIVRGRRLGDLVRGVGLRFSGLDAPSQAILAASLRGHPPPIPTRALRRDYARTVRLISTWSSMMYGPTVRRPKPRQAPVARPVHSPVLALALGH